MKRQYIPEIMKIIKSGVENNEKKLRAYSQLLIDKLREDGKNDIADRLHRILTGEYKNLPQLKLRESCYPQT